MTARVLPTEPGWWWCKWDDCATFVVEVDRENDGSLVVAMYSLDWTVMEKSPAHPKWRWLEPVAPLGTVARLEAERDEARRIAEARRTRIEVLEAQLLESADGWNWGAR